ncbi:rRNA-processing protein LAS1 [Aspergillus foveolatus]|uniref:rRNA-processing protein LAS1 n=1 Tax=Aspergillus foveolatus TaxID=210207 RepID=UPI003CCD9FB3
MAKVIFTPWKRHSDLLAVRKQFYPPPEYDGPDLRSQACATNSLFAIRATYAAAFCRFVTGLVDSKLGARRSMFSRALELGLPASFVELRHEATHRELPSLTVLRGATGRSLEWLWGFYWGSLSSGPLSGAGVGAGSAVDGLLRGLLQQAGALLGSGNAINDGESGDGGADGPPKKKRRVQRELAGVAARAVGILKEHREGEAGEQGTASKPGWVLARTMLRDGFLVPSERRPNDTQSLTTSISKWDPFLQMVAEGDSSFLVTLAEAMVDELAFPASSSKSDPKSDPTLEGIYTWLDHILHSPQWELHRRLISLSYIRAVCESSLSGNYWMATLKERIVQVENGKKKGKGKGKGESSADGLPVVAPAGHASTAGDSAGLLNINQEDIETLRRFGWEPAETSGWDSRALGVVG